MSTADPTTGREWSAQELTMALLVGYGPNRRGTPNLTAAAAAVGVTPRSLRRWLRGERHPGPEHAQALRTALLPPAQALQSQERERQWALRIASQDPSVAVQEQGWDLPHELQVETHPQLGLARPVVTKHEPAKKRYPPKGWQIQSSHTFPTRAQALIAKHDLLAHHGPFRVRVLPQWVDKGRHECWLLATEEPSP